eukprot:gene361-994_t
MEMFKRKRKRKRKLKDDVAANNSGEERECDNSVGLAALPEVVLLNILRFLETDHIIQFSMTCKRINEILPKFKRIRAKDFDKYGPSSGNWCPEKWFDGPRLKNKIKKITMSMRWVDQGYGNRKGEVWLKLMRGKTEITECRNTFGRAKHDEEFRNIEICKGPIVMQSKEGDHLRVMHNVGGGGGHSLSVKHFQMILEFENFYGAGGESQIV